MPLIVNLFPTVILPLLYCTVSNANSDSSLTNNHSSSFQKLSDSSSLVFFEPKTHLIFKLYFYDLDQNLLFFSLNCFFSRFMSEQHFLKTKNIGLLASESDSLSIFCKGKVPQNCTPHIQLSSISLCIKVKVTAQ